MVETRERGKQPYRETRRTPCTVVKTLKTRNLLNLHWLFCLRISAKSWTTFCRDRIAPNCTIRHPVCKLWPIVALQRRVRFSARLAGFCRIRWHQRRARRAERASFSGPRSCCIASLITVGDFVASATFAPDRRSCGDDLEYGKHLGLSHSTIGHLADVRASVDRSESYSSLARSRKGARR